MQEGKVFLTSDLIAQLDRVQSFGRRLGGIEQELTRMRKLVEENLAPTLHAAVSDDANRLLYSTKDAARALCCCRQTVLLLVAQGHLRAHRIGRVIRIHRVDIEDMARKGLPSV